MRQPTNEERHGKKRSDFTYVDDIFDGVVRVMGRPATPDPAWSSDAPDPGTSYLSYRVYNIGNNQPIELMRLVEVLEKALGRKAEKEFLPMQPGEVLETYADVDDLMRDMGFAPATPIEEGVRRFADWYLAYVQGEEDL